MREAPTRTYQTQYLFAPQGLGFAVGLVGSGAMMYYTGKRTADTEFDDNSFPGMKAWPAGMCLISFFAFNVFFQALRAEFGI